VQRKFIDDQSKQVVSLFFVAVFSKRNKKHVLHVFYFLSTYYSGRKIKLVFDNKIPKESFTSAVLT